VGIGLGHHALHAEHLHEARGQGLAVRGEKNRDAAVRPEYAFGELHFLPVVGYARIPDQAARFQTFDFEPILAYRHVHQRENPIHARFGPLDPFTVIVGFDVGQVIGGTEPDQGIGRWRSVLVDDASGQSRGFGPAPSPASFSEDAGGQEDGQQGGQGKERTSVARGRCMSHGEPHAFLGPGAKVRTAGRVAAAGSVGGTVTGNTWKFIWYTRSTSWE